MARPLRIQYPGAWYHVTCRGNERAPIYQDDKDKKRFLMTLGGSVEAFHVEVHCYTLMSNHFHFLLKTPDANLSRFMQRFNTTYITYYNLRHHRSGHLYQGRYKSFPAQQARPKRSTRPRTCNPSVRRGIAPRSAFQRVESRKGKACPRAGGEPENRLQTTGYRKR